MKRRDHDTRYHRFFGDPRIVAQLLREFVDEPYLADLDLDRIERLNAKFHAETNEARAGDTAWRIPRRDGTALFVVLILEFQSTTDRWMAVRALVYAGLLWQHLIRERMLPADGTLPPVLPVVLYNGDPRWSAPTELRTLIGLPEGSPLWRWQPRIGYHLIDEGAFADAALASREGLPAMLFRLEKSGDAGVAVAVADAVLAVLRRHPEFDAVKAIFRELIGNVIRRHDPGAEVPEDLQEVRNMLETRAEAWQEKWRQQGMLAGRQEGEAAAVLRLLERRFGPLREDTRDRVLAADVPTLESWLDRAINAPSLEDVLD